MSSRVALITGSSRGIGREIALRLAADGYDIALNDLPSAVEDLRDVEKEILKIGRKAIVCIADVVQEKEVEQMVEVVVEKLGGLDVMVANAGILIANTFLEATLDEWDTMFNVNGKGVYLCYKYAAKQMIKQGRGGRIIGACSLAGKKGSVFMPLYGATKSVVRSLTQSAATALQKHGITVNAYAPAFVKTPLLDKFAEDVQKWGVAGSLFDSAGQPSEIAALVSYLASDQAGYVNGQCINLNGGQHCE